MAVIFTGRDLIVDFEENPSSGADHQYRIEYQCASSTVVHYVANADFRDVDAQGNRQYVDTLTYEENRAAGLTRTPIVRLYTQNANGKWSEPAVVQANNPQPTLPSTPTVTPTVNGVVVNITRPQDNDVAGYRIWRSTNSPVALTDENLVFDGPDTSPTITLPDENPNYIVVAPYDSFDQEGLNVSPEIPVLAASGLQNNAITIDGSGIINGIGTTNINVDNRGVVLSGLFSDRPASGSYIGQTYLATDRLELFRWNGSEWSIVSDVSAFPSGPASSVFNYSSTGVAEGGQFPRGLIYQFNRLTGALGSGVTWTYRVNSGVVNGFSAGPTFYAMSGTGSGTLTVDSLGTNTNEVTVRGTAGGQVVEQRVVLNKDFATPNNTGGGGGTAVTASQSSSFGSFSSPSYQTISNELQVTAGTTTQAANINLQMEASSTQTVGLLVERWNGSAWVAFGAEEQSNIEVEGELSGGPDPIFQPFITPAFFSFTRSIEVTAGSNQRIRLRARRIAGPTDNVFVTGTLVLEA